MRPNIRSYISEYIWRNSHLSFNQRKSEINPQINSRHISILKNMRMICNNLHPKLMIKFDFNYSKTHVKFFRHHNKKPTFSKTFINTTKKSEQPESLKRIIPFSRALRLKQICIKKGNFKEKSKILTERLIDRGFITMRYNRNFKGNHHYYIGKTT